MENRFSFTSKYKNITYILMAIGLIAVLYGVFMFHDHGARVWSNFLLNTIYFLLISLCGMVFIGIHSLGTSGWQTSVQRIPEAMMTFLPVGSIFYLIILIGVWFNLHHLYHWAHFEGTDALLESKKGFLNIPFFTVRAFIYLFGWTFLAMWYRKTSLAQDTDGDLKHFRKSNNIAGGFIVFFAITNSTSSWDFLMSIDPHWFSALYGWYCFAAQLASGVGTIILLVLLLRKNGLMPHINNEHLHDLGKYLFAFSVLWAYLWFSQFMLIWYANLPEETIYFKARLMTSFRPLLFTNIIINFAFPFLVLMTRNAKRNKILLPIAAIGVIIGHWLDLYLLVMPGTIGPDKAGIGFLEIGMFLGFTGVFLFVVFKSLAKAALVPINHPYLKESYDYHTQY